MQSTSEPAHPQDLYDYSIPLDQATQDAPEHLPRRGLTGMTGLLGLEQEHQPTLFDAYPPAQR